MSSQCSYCFGAFQIPSNQGLIQWMATQPENPTTPGHSACLKRLLTHRQVGPVNLTSSTENVGAGRPAEDNGTNHKRKAEGLSIMFLPQKFLWE